MIISRKDKIPRLNTRKNIAKFNTNGPLIFRKFMKLLKSERKLFKIGIRSKLAKLISRRKLSKFGRKSPFLKVKKLFEVSCFDKNLLTQW